MTSAVGLATVATFALSSLVVSACSTTDAGGTTPLLTVMDGSSTPGTKTPPSSDGGASDAATPPPFDAGGSQPAIDTLCAAATQLGKPTEQVVESSPEYSPSGGTVVTATYTLAGLYSYTGGLFDGGAGDDDDDGGEDPLPDASVSDGSTGDNGGPTASIGDVVEEKTLVLATDGLFSLASATGTVDAGVGATTITAGVYVVSGDTITFHGTCPSTSESSYSFSASGGALALYEPGGIVEVFDQRSEP
jgi:hypothetical protein